MKSWWRRLYGWFRGHAPACAVVPEDLDEIRNVLCPCCSQMKPPPSCDDDMPNVCDDCWNTHSTAPEALRARERHAGERA